MFSNTAYEALYQYLGLELHGRFIDVLTSQRVFWAVLVLIFGSMFFATTVRFFSRYLPGVLVQRRQVPLSRYVRLVLCLIVGISILRVGSDTAVRRFDGTSWDGNPYVKSKGVAGHAVQPEYRVSLVFDLLSRSAEEVAGLLSRVVDDLFKVNHSQLDAPDFFYKAVMYAGAATITDPKLKEAVGFYTSECLERALPLIAGAENLKRLDGMFGGEAEVDQTLATLAVDAPERPGYNCLDAKNDVRSQLISYTSQQSPEFRAMLRGFVGSPMNETAWLNLQASMALVDQYVDGHESFAGIQKGAQPPSGAARVFQYLNRFFSWDHMTTLFTGREGHGASLAAERSQEFSENLARAPHVAGFIKMALIALFPWLVFPVVAGHWRVLGYWSLTYFSVLLWTPIWTLFYHIIVGISLSAETMTAFGKLSDGLSLYSASLLTSRMNYMFAVYSWLQLLLGAAFTSGLLWILRPVLSDGEGDRTPEFLGDAGDVVHRGVKAAGSAAALL